jgi:drug/metabolite transporter (DMT)-like permease
VQIPWYVSATGAALIWGLHYPLIGYALKKVSMVSVLLLTALPVFLVAVLFRHEVLADYRTLMALDWPQRLTILALALTSLSASALLFSSIGSKNATLASLIEISYPVFVAGFAFLFFRETQASASVMIGALLVFTGVGVIIFQSP